MMIHVCLFTLARRRMIMNIMAFVMAYLLHNWQRQILAVQAITFLISGPDWIPDLASSNKLTVMYSAEAYFLRAEGAVNGWNMGSTAKELYEQGIRLSMQQWGVNSASINSYIQSTSLPAAPGDYLNSPAVTNIPVKFAADKATQLQQIATQKWLALFPDGIEAWAEVRRTGYPVLYPVANSDNPDMPANQIIKRFTFIDLEYESNNQAVQNALPLLNGPDKNNTPVWWDVH